jgi:hypothetical protein
MTSFVANSGSELEKCNEQLATVEAAFKETLKFYGEHLTTSATDFLGSVARFVTSFDKAKADLVRWAELAEKQKQAAARRAKVRTGGGRVCSAVLW